MALDNQRPIQACPGEGRGFVDKNQVPGIERGLAAAECSPLLGYVGAVLLGGVPARFLSVMFCALRNRHKLVSATLIPHPARALRISCKVKSGRRANSSATAARCSGERER
jgi:hypothetical protein